jgi:Proteasome subunit
MSEKGVQLPRATSTGTTIVGCLFKDGIVLGADTRATEGEIVADKNCEKVLTYSPSLCLFNFYRVLARSTTLQTPSDAVVQVQLRILNLLLPSSLPTWNYTPCQLGGSLVW